MSKHWEQLENGAPIYDREGNVYGFEGKLIFDEFTKHYILTLDAVKNELNVDLEIVRGSKENANVFLEELSELLYAYIFKKKPAQLREKTEYFLAFDMRNRRVLYRSLIDLVRYAFFSGGNIMAYQPGVNLNETGTIDIETLRDERMVSYVTDSILKTNRLVDRFFIEKFTPIKEEEW